jgi:hypothetical protein
MKTLKSLLPHAPQVDLAYFEASEDNDEEFYAGGGQFRRHGLEHFPQLWCANGSYSVYGQARNANPPLLCVDNFACPAPHASLCTPHCSWDADLWHAEWSPTGAKFSRTLQQIVL